MSARRTTLVVSVATFVGATVVATLVLGNALAANTGGAGWTGYVPIGSITRTFWSEAFFVGPVIGLVAAACAALLTDRVARRAH